MKDQEKTKEQLIDKLVELRKRVAAPEESGADFKRMEKEGITGGRGKILCFVRAGGGLHCAHRL